VRSTVVPLPKAKHAARAPLEWWQPIAAPARAIANAAVQVTVLHYTKPVQKPKLTCVEVLVDTVSALLQQPGQSGVCARMTLAYCGSKSTCGGSVIVLAGKHFG
jgi:hypothetical protein